jgi:hypothetical protein
MIAKTSLPTLFLVGALAAFGSSAGADSVKFYTGDGGYGGPFNGAGTVYQATQGTATNCPTPANGCSGSDVVGVGDQTYNPFGSSTVQITASANNGGPWGDFQPPFGGMGVGTGSPGDTDQIAGSDVLHLHFAVAVTLTGIGTLFDNQHSPFGTGFPDNFNIGGGNSFLLSLTGLAGSFNSVLFGTANTVGGISITGTDFFFMENSEQPTFYVSALTYNPVPGPVVGAGLPGLIAACGGLLALARRRRQLIA